MCQKPDLHETHETVRPPPASCVRLEREGASPLWRAAAFVGFYGVGIALNLTWGWKILKGAYKVLMQADRQKGGDVATKES